MTPDTTASDGMSETPCETDIWERLEALAASEGGTFTIYPAYSLRDGSFGPWTILYERRVGRGARRARYERAFGEGPSRIQALTDLALQLTPIGSRP